MSDFQPFVNAFLVEYMPTGQQSKFLFWFIIAQAYHTSVCCKRSNLSFLLISFKVCSCNYFQSGLFDIVLCRYLWFNLTKKLGESPEVIVVELPEDNIGSRKHRMTWWVISTNNPDNITPRPLPCSRTLSFDPFPIPLASFSNPVQWASSSCITPAVPRKGRWRNPGR